MKFPPAHCSEHQTSWFIPLMNYRHNAAPLGQFSRIVCVIRCSHPFIIRHQLLMKNQWNWSPPTYVSVGLDLLIHVCLQFQSDRAEVRTHSSAAEGSSPIRQRSTPCKQTACHLDVLFTRLLLFFNATLERDIHWKKEYRCFAPKKRQSSPPVSRQTKFFQSC